MNNFVNHILAICCFLILTTSAVAQDGARGSVAESINSNEVVGEKRALVIGISEYQSTELNLNYADDDAFLFKQYLTKIDSVPHQNITYLVNKDATSFNILSALNDLIDSSEEGDTVYLFFAGHGDVVQKDSVENKIGFLLAHDTNKDREFYGTQGVVPFEDVNKTVNEIANKKAKIILVLDACKSGYLYLNGAQKNLEAANNTFENATKFLSCKPNELSYESTNEEDLSQGFFTYYLVLGFMGAADNMIQDFNLHYFELEMFLKTNLASATNNKQTPVIDTKASTEIFRKVNSKDKSEALKQVQDQQKLTALLANRNSENNIESIYNEDSSILKQFNEALHQKNFYGNSDSAIEIYKTAKNQELVSKHLSNRMRTSIVNSLSTDAQLLINNYISNISVLPPSLEFSRKAKDLEKCLEILEQSHYSYNRILTSKLFLEAYAIIRARNFSNYPEAKQKLNKALQIEEKAAYIHNALGIVLNHENNYEEAYYHYNKAAELIPTWSFPVNNIGTNYFDQYQYKKAKKYMSDALELQDSYSTALNNLGAVSENQGRYTDAEAYYLSTYDSEIGYSAITLRNLANLHRKKGNIKRAVYYYEQALLENPNDVNIYFDYSDLLMEESIDIKKAEAFLAYAIELEPYFSRGYAELADILRRHPKNNESGVEALELYNFAIENDPFYEWAYAGKGWLYHKQDLKTEALASFNKGVEINSHKAKPYLYLANYYEAGLKDKTKAQELLVKAIEIDSFYLPAYESLIALYNKANQQEKSIEILGKLVEWNANAPDVFNLLGNTHFSNNDYTNAVKSYQKAVKVDSTYAKGFTNLAYSLLKTGKHSEAVEAYRKAVFYNPYKNELKNFTSLLLTEARLNIRNENFDAAEALLKESYGLDSSYESTYALSMFYYLRNNAIEALKVAQTLELDELSKTRKLKYLELLTKVSVDLNQKTESEKYYNQFKELSPRPNHILQALVLFVSGNESAAKEVLATANAISLKDKYLSKKYNQSSIKIIKQLQNE